MPKVILPNIARSLEKHLMGYSKLLSKPHYKHFKQAVIGICEGSSSMADLGRSFGVPERTWWHFFNESCFDDMKLLTQSARVMGNYAQTRSTEGSFLILDFTSTFKTGKCFEWSDWLWDEDTDIPDKIGHEQLIALEYSPVKDFRRCLGFRRFYHDDKLFETEYWRDDFEKKGVAVSKLLFQVKPLTLASEVLVDGEFIHEDLVKKFESAGFKWTGRIKKSILVTFKGKTQSMESLAQELIKSKQIDLMKAKYRNQEVIVAETTVTVPSLDDRCVKVAICQNRQGKLAFLGTNILTRKPCEIVKIYGFRWEIEVFFKDIKQNLSFGDYRMRKVGANTRWQIFTLIAANLLELIRKTKLEKIIELPKLNWLKVAVEKMYSVVDLTLGVTVNLIRGLRLGGKEMLCSLRRCLELNKAKYYLYKEVNLARL